MPETVSGIMGWLDTLDKLSLFSLVVGLAVTILTFWLGYRKTIGARDERIFSRNRDLVAAAVQRIAVEREKLSVREFASMRRAAAYYSKIPEDRIHAHGMILDLVTFEVIENRYLDKASKASILQLIEESVDNKETVWGGSQSRTSAETDRIVYFLGIASTVAGVSATTLLNRSATDNISELFSENSLLVFTAGTLIFAIIGVVVIVTGYRQESKRSKNISDRATLDKETLSVERAGNDISERKVEYITSKQN